jgi:hypothetical protein
VEAFCGKGRRFNYSADLGTVRIEGEYKIRPYRDLSVGANLVFARYFWRGPFIIPTPDPDFDFDFDFDLAVPSNKKGPLAGAGEEVFHCMLVV